MGRNKRLLLSFFAFNMALSGYLGANDALKSKYGKLYDNAVKNIENGKSNEKLFSELEKVLEQRKKEQRDL